MLHLFPASISFKIKENTCLSLLIRVQYGIGLNETMCVGISPKVEKELC